MRPVESVRARSQCGKQLPYLRRRHILEILNGMKNAGAVGCGSFQCTGIPRHHGTHIPTHMFILSIHVNTKVCIHAGLHQYSFSSA
jgi:hypothetical protein